MNVNSLKLMGMLLICNILSLNSFAQSVGINDDDSNPNANAILDVKSTTKGFLVPRMTTAERTTFTSSLATADQAMLVFDTDLASFYYWNGSAWTALSVSAIKIVEDADGDTKIQIEKNSDEDIIRFDVKGTEVMVIDSLGNVGIGTDAPGGKFEVSLGNISVGEQTMVSQTSSTNTLSTGGLLRQSFTATETASLTKVSALYDATASGFSQIYIEDNSGTIIYTSSSVNLTGGGWIDFPVSGVNISRDSAYTIEFTYADRILYDTGNPYSGGRAHFNSNWDIAFTVLAEWSENRALKVEDDGITLSTYKFPASDGSTNQLLLTDGNGTLTWTDLNNTTLSILQDGDNDTKIEVEKINDEDEIYFNVAGSERMVIDGSGNVGIGISSPSAKLDVSLGTISLVNTEMVSQTVYDGPRSDNINLWQSFTATDNGELTIISLQLENSATGTKTLDIYAGEGDGSTVLYTTSAIDVTGGGWVDFPISGVNMTSGEKYTFDIKNVLHVYESNSGLDYYLNGRNEDVSDADFAFKITYKDSVDNSFEVAGDGISMGGYKLPTTDGTVNQTLLTDGSGTVSWSTLTDLDNQTVDKFSLAGSTLSLSLLNDGASDYTVDLSSFLDNTDNQTVDKFSLAGSALSLSLLNDGASDYTVDLSSFLDNTDNQTVDKFSLAGSTLSLSLLNDGASDYTVDLSSFLDNTDNQTVDKFSLAGSTLSLSLLNDGASDYTVDLSSLIGDPAKIADTDDDTKIQVEKSADEDYIRFDVAGTEAMNISSAGNVGIGISNPSSLLHIAMEKVPSPSTTTLAISQTVSEVNSDWAGNANNWQSFTATEDGGLDSILLNFHSSASGTRTLSIYEGEGTSGTLLHTTSAIDVSAGGWIAFPISDAIMTAGQKYTFYINTRAYLYFTSGDPYSGGIYGHAPSFDFAFQIYIRPLEIDETKGFMVEEDGVTINSYKLPASDGSNGQVLATNGSGAMDWVNPLAATSNIELSGNWLSNDGDNEGVFVATNGNVGVGTNSTSYQLQVGNSGDGSQARANAWNTFSDRRWKTNFQTIKEPLKKLSLINGYYYNWKTGVDKSLQVGVIAQEIEAVLPQIVSTDANGYKSVDYSKITALLIEVNKAQQKEIETLKTKLTELETLKTQVSEMEQLKAEVAAIKTLLQQGNKSIQQATVNK